jgi:hypothetical protein
MLFLPEPVVDTVCVPVAVGSELQHFYHPQHLHEH